MQVVFYEDGQLCVLDWAATSPYSTTLLVLVFVPSILTVVNTGRKILQAMRNPGEVSVNERFDRRSMSARRSLDARGSLTQNGFRREQSPFQKKAAMTQANSHDALDVYCCRGRACVE